MKTRHPRRRPSGFTLVELLVVISIIAVLAAMAFGAARSAINRAKKLETANNATALYQALDAFNSEYSRLPDVGMQGDEMVTEGQSGQDLLRILLGKEETGSTMQNPRQIAFLNAKEGKTKAKGGLIYSKGSGNTIEGFYDAYGQAFRLKFDDDYDDEIQDPLTPGNIIRGKKVIIYSYGIDKKIGGGDDVKSW
jgi:prepilin-type N-terminal cleavage/methylation domain-containing protein